MRVRRTTTTLGVALGAALASLAACGGSAPPARPPPAKPPPADPPALARIAAACARVSSCTIAHDAARFRDPSACVDGWFGEPSAPGSAPDPLRSCLIEATSCAEVSVCMQGGGDARAAAFCSQRQGVVSGCDGERLVSCGEDDAHASSVVDCAAIGASCREVRSTGGLVVRACWSAEKCPAGAPESRCDGPGAVIACRDGAYERIDCRPGTTCEERKDMAGELVAACELPGRRRCDARGARRCEGDRLVECDHARHFSAARVTDCASFGLRCAGVGLRAGCFVPANVECDKERLPRCDGDAVVFCAAGRLAKLSCRELGLETCNPAARGSMAACTPSTSTPPK